MPTRQIKDVIRNQVILTMPATASVREAADRMRRLRVGSAMVVDAAGRLEGIFTERDGLFRVLADGLDPDATPLAAVMTAHPTTIAPDRKLSHALHIMSDSGFRHLPVVTDGRPVGMVSIRDALGSELSNFEREVAAKAGLGEILG